MNAFAAMLMLSMGVPLVLAALSLVLRRPRHLLPWGAAPGLAAAFASQGAEASLDFVLLGASMQLDLLGAVFLGFSSFVWLCAGGYAIAYLGDARERSFCAFWQLTLAGVAGAFLAADVALFYVSFAILSLAAFVLVAHERTPSTERAARIYIILAIAGETSLLLGLIISSAGAESMSISHVRAALVASPWRWEATLALLVGFGIKAGLVPLHVWLPLAHSAAPTPASAVLSGVIVKAGIIGLIRFLPVGDVFAAWSVAIIWLGLATTFYGAVAGLFQSNPKVILAYSTMSQMGLIVAVIGAAMPSADPGSAHGAAALYATHHGLAKAALFLAFGIIATSDGFRRHVALVLAAIIGAAIAGLPFTGGALAKLAIKGPLGDGPAALMASLSAVLTMLLITRFIAMAARSERPNPNTRAAPRLLMTIAFHALAIAALAAPWFLFPLLGGHSVSYAVTQAAIWDAGWPIAAALLIAGAFWALRLSLPNAPVGDIVLVAERLVQALQTVSQRRAHWHAMPQLNLRGPALPKSDVFLPWPACTAALAGIGIALAIIMAIGAG